MLLEKNRMLSIVLTSQENRSMHHRNSASIFSAALLVTSSCLSHLSLLPPPHKFLLLSDSLSSLQAMQDPHSPNPIVQRILILLHSLSSSSSTCAFLWILGHITHYRSFITSSWHNTWPTQPLTKLRSIKKNQLLGPLQIVHFAMKK